MVVGDDGDGFWVQVCVLGGFGVGIRVAHEIQFSDAFD